MPKKKEQTLLSPDELMAELDRLLEALRRGEISEMEVVHWWWQHFGIKGKGILASFLKQRELARGWNTKPKRKRKRS